MLCRCAKQGNVDGTFGVFVDGQYAASDEIRTTAQVRTLMVGFDNGTSVIEITGTHMVPVQSTNMTSSNMTTSTVVNNATNSGGNTAEHRFVNPGTNIGNSTFPNTTTTNSTAGSSNSNAQTHPVVDSTYSIPAAESVSIPFSIPSDVTSAYLSGTVLITGGLLSTVDFSIVNSNTGSVLMRQVYTDQGNIGAVDRGTVMKRRSTKHVSEVTAIASRFGNSAKIIVPRSWLRRRVIAFLHSEYISKHAEERTADE